MRILLRSSIFAFVFLFSAVAVFAQHKMDRILHGQVQGMLKNVKNEIKKSYFDPNFKGVDIDARFAAAEEKLKKIEQLDQGLAIIAQAVLDLNDSHTRFYPPPRAGIVEYGWRVKAFGNSVFIAGVKEGSDAEKVGLKVGDEVLAINGFRPTRSELWKIMYYYLDISPRTAMQLEVRSAAGEVRTLTIKAKLTAVKRRIDLSNSIDINEIFREGDKLKNLDKHRFREVGTALVWQMPTFAFDPKQVGGLMARARGKSTLILDLRGNGGGYVVTLEEMAGYFFKEDIKIADLKGRKKMDPQMAKTAGSNTFDGKVIVLIDADSASASELFARVMQIHKRGVVLGDISAGAVMQSMYEPMQIGVDSVLLYGMNLTRADVIMTDGKSLEHVGVTPDEIILPTGSDLATRSDRVMARALEISGNPMDAAAAGKLFPPEPFISRVSNLAWIWEN